MIFLLLGVGLSAQQLDLIEPAAWTVSSLDSSQQQRYQKYIDNYGAANITKIKVNALTAALDTNNLQFKDPDFSSTLLEFSSQNVQYDSPQDYYWYGKLSPQSSPVDYGYMMLMSRDGERFGKVNLDERVFSIADIGGKNILIDHSQDSAAFDFKCGGAIPPPEDSLYQDSSSQGEIVPRDGIEGACEARILVLFTPAAAGRIGEENIQNLAEESVAVTNQALSGSSVPLADLRFALAGVEELEYDENDIIYDEVLDDITFSTGNGTARALRDEFNADLVILLVDDFIMSNPGVAGLAWQGPNDFFAFGVVQVVNTNTNHAFSHEVGHITGAEHEPCNAHLPGVNCCGDCANIPMADPVNRAHTWERTRGWWIFKGIVDETTIMYSGSTIARSAPRYSNPDVDWLGSSTGIMNERENAQIMEDNGCEVAGFRETQGVVEVTFEGSHFGCGTQNLCVNIESDGDPVDWRWQYSYNGVDFFNLSQYSGNEPCITASFPNNSGTTRYYRVEVRSEVDGDIIGQATFFVVGSCQGLESPGLGNEGGAYAEKEALKIYPSPAKSSTLNCDFYVTDLEEGAISIQVFDVLGQRHFKSTLGYLEKGKYTFEVPLGPLPGPGTYFLQLLTDAGPRKALPFVFEQ